ncbi:hypothetical protein BKA65DRAFT_460797 [Rhexocercosporidium sp. MPI-PUGE-AT-0058]|nr:hypothetical protein BKA65DRAFT_460797 [Rhexocercosporidium sp. MPI-PUGE-AT-0058]
MDKEEYFRQLYSLNESSDEEEVNTNEAREVLRQSEPASLSLSTSFPASQASRSSQRRSQVASTLLRKAPAIQRTTSAPVTGNRSIVNELEPLRRKTSLIRNEISSSTQDIDIATPPAGHTTPLDINTSFSSNAKPVPERSASTPNIGSVVMNNSKGIAAMLGKRTGESLAGANAKKKAAPKKKDVIKMVPEAERVFDGKTIYWIPDNDVVPIRKKRIERAREFGAVWAREWTPEITHVVVDNDLNYQNIIDFLTPKIKSDKFPKHITLVNENYVVQCAQFKLLLDPKQRQYYVKGCPEATGSKSTSPPGSQNSEQSLQLKAAKPRKGDHVPERITPSQSQPPMQGIDQGHDADGTSRISLMPDYHTEIDPQQTSRPNTPPENNMGKRGDILDEWIDLARRTKDVTLDDDADEDEDRLSSRDDPDDTGDSEDERARKNKPKRRYTKYASNKLDSFSCMHGGTGKVHKDNPNGKIIDILEQMSEYNQRIGDHWRTRAYQRAVGTLKALKVHVESYEDAIRLPFIGERIAKKIEEISVTGHLRRLDNALNDPTDKVLQLFLKIYGVGLSQAHKWIQAGHKTLEDILALPDITKNQRIGIEHYYDFDSRIPRDEVTALGEIVKRTTAEIDPQVRAIIGGSYRRGAETSGDIDFIITKRNTSSSHDLLSFLQTLVSRLTSSGFLVAPLAVPKDSGSKWHGACVLPGNPTWRRIDFLVVPETEFGAALLYFTGDDIFNRSMRLLASTMGMRLNQRGLYKDVLRTHGRVKLTEGTLVEGADERAIFDSLGVPWRPAHERICR